MPKKKTESELTVVQPNVLPAAPTAQGASTALRTYREIQRVFDEQMPDAIIEIKGKQFRKKSYWRAIANAFGVTCEVISVERIEIPASHPRNDGDWGYTAVVRATQANGRTSDGDGACMASEKVDRDGKPTAMQTVHNVRSHAVTRAKNRAISDLVGFGEVSADELGPHDLRQATAKKPRAEAASTDQLKLLGARATAKARELITTSEAEGIEIGYPTQTALKDAIAVAARDRVGCGETILASEVDPLIIAIDACWITKDGALKAVGGD